MLTVGLTGSIAVGKSFVCSVLLEAGIPVLDADLIARQVVSPGTDGLAAIVNAFGTEILGPSGDLDRKRLGTIIFNDPEKRQLLNGIIHPLVFRVQDDWVKRQYSLDPSGLVVIDAALMLESGGYERLDTIVVVWCERDIQLQRLMLRDNLDRSNAENRIAAQMSQDEKKRYADYLINTSRGFDDTRRQTLRMLNILRRANDDNDS